MEQAFHDFFNWLAEPKLFFAVFTASVFAMLYWRRFFTQPKVAVAILVGATLIFIVALRHDGFRANMSKGDNIPIVFMLLFVGFFSWLSLRRAVANDDRIARGELPEEAVETPRKVLVWPDLVYTEMLCIILGTVVLLVWSMAIDAPLEEPANPGKTPNPSKAPWYFLGLQEMLVYYDPWLAGVIFPGLIIVGLCAIPYVDPNPKGNGYYTFNERPFAIVTFFFGFVVLWVSMIILMTFLRGPNQAFFGPFEDWNPHKVEPTVNVQFSQIVWEHWFGMNKPDFWLVREMPGIVLVVGYLAVLPVLLGLTVFRKMMAQMGQPRYLAMVVMLLLMVALPIKMILRWSINLQYFVNIQEIFLNI